MKFKNILLITALTLYINAEQSVYSDSDFIDSDAVAKKNSREIFILKQKISQLKETIEGLKTIIKGQNNQIERLNQRLNSSANLEKIVNELSQRVAALETNQHQIAKQEVSNTNSIVSNNTSLSSSKSVTKTAKASNEELYKAAVLNFTKSKLSKAQSQFKQLLNKGYKKASIYFYLGEIAYKKGKYKEAISYYQKSATLNENASYMDKLLLHTAISLKKAGKKEDAKVFFRAVIDGYPSSNSAKEAKKYIK